MSQDETKSHNLHPEYFSASSRARSCPSDLVVSYTVVSYDDD